MNLWRWLAAPWVAAQRGSRWLMIGIAVLGVLVSVCVRVFADDPSAATAAAYPLAIVVGLTWTFFFPNMLVLVITARKLCLPGIRRDVIASLCLYAILTTSLPALLLACVGAHLLVTMLMLALAVGICMLYAILPWYMNFGICVLPWAIIELPSSIGLPSPDSPTFVSHACVAVLLLFLLAVWRWFRLLRRDIPAGTIRQPLILGLNRNLLSVLDGQGRFGGSSVVTYQNEMQMLRRRPAWMQPRANVRHTGPGARHRPSTLRIALGAVYLPRTVRDRVRTLQPIVLAGLLLAALLALSMTMAGPITLDTWQFIGMAAIGIISFSINLMLPLTTAATLQQRFSRTNGELPLLALLPNLGPAADVRRDLFRVCLSVPLCAQAVAAIALTLLALALHVHDAALLLVLVAQLSSMLSLGAAVVDVLGGRLLSFWVRTPLAILASMLFSLSCWIPLTTLGATPWPAAHIVVPLLLAAWLPLGVVLLWIGHRAWHALQQRPHPFLANLSG